VTGRPAFLDLSDAPAEFRLAAVAVAAMPTDLRRELGREVRATILPRASVMYAQAPGATSTGNRLPFVTTRRPTVTTRQGVVTGLRFGGGRKLKGGATVAQLVRPVEFGSAGESFTTYTRKGRTVERRTTRAFTPRRATGRVIWPTTFDRVAPMVLTAWTRAVFRLVDREAA
jgi:hypothetical protein